MLLDRADSDIYNAKLLLSPVGNPTNDELITDIAAYHVQQAIEKALKYLIYTLSNADPENREYRTHNITSLILLAEDLCGFYVSEQLKAQSYAITRWESKSRYEDSSVAVKKDIQNAIEMYNELREQIISVIEKQN